MKELWKKGLAVLGLMVISVLLIYGDGYRTKKENDRIMEQDRLEAVLMVDEQYLIEECGVTKEELEGVDVAHFVSYCGFTLQDFQERDIPLVLREYKKMLQWEAEWEEQQKNVKDDYAWMFDEKERGGYKDEYLEDITVIAIWSSSGMYRESVIYDLENQVYYFGELVDVTQDYSQATATGELSDEDVEAIRKLAGEAWIDEWPAKSGWVRPRDHDYSTFVMRIATSDGSVYGYWGERLFPSTFPSFYKGMKEQVGL